MQCFGKCFCIRLQVKGRRPLLSATLCSYWVYLLLRDLTDYASSFSDLRKERVGVSEMLCFLVTQNSGRCAKSRIPVVLLERRTPLSEPFGIQWSSMLPHALFSLITLFLSGFRFLFWYCSLPSSLWSGKFSFWSVMRVSMSNREWSAAELSKQRF
jgi:hypothetical protein